MFLRAYRLRACQQRVAAHGRPAVDGVGPRCRSDRFGRIAAEHFHVNNMVLAGDVGGGDEDAGGGEGRGGGGHRGGREEGEGGTEKGGREGGMKERRETERRGDERIKHRLRG